MKKAPRFSTRGVFLKNFSTAEAVNYLFSFLLTPQFTGCPKSRECKFAFPTYRHVQRQQYSIKAINGHSF